jgi:hypothetical protein
MNLERRAPSRPVPEPFQQYAEAVLGGPGTWFIGLRRENTFRRNLFPVEAGRKKRVGRDFSRAAKSDLSSRGFDTASGRAA